jgi:hypothetical protein
MTSMVSLERLSAGRAVRSFHRLASRLSGPMPSGILVRAGGAEQVPNRMIKVAKDRQRIAGFLMGFSSP